MGIFSTAETTTTTTTGAHTEGHRGTRVQSFHLCDFVHAISLKVATTNENARQKQKTENIVKRNIGGLSLSLSHSASLALSLSVFLALFSFKWHANVRVKWTYGRDETVRQSYCVARLFIFIFYLLL